MEGILSSPWLMGAEASPDKRSLYWYEALPSTSSSCLCTSDSNVAAYTPGTVHANPLRGSSTITVKCHKKATTPETCTSEVQAVHDRLAAIANVPRSNDTITTHQRVLLVVVNPNSGGRKGRRIFERQMRPLLEAAGISCHVHYTSYSGHAADIGKQFFTIIDGETIPYGVLLVGGDGTVHEFINGFFAGAARRACAPDGTASIPAVVSRLQRDFACLRLCTVACGTQNALAVGLRTTQPEYAAWCLIRNRVRTLDALEVRNATGAMSLSLCGVGWGVAAAIAADSEDWRCMGTSRYTFLKIKHGGAAGLGLQEYPATVRWGTPSQVTAALRGSLGSPGDKLELSSTTTVSSDGASNVESASADGLLGGAGLSIESLSPPNALPAPNLVSCRPGCVSCAASPHNERRMAALAHLARFAAHDAWAQSAPTGAGLALDVTPVVSPRSVAPSIRLSEPALSSPLLLSPSETPGADFVEASVETGKYVTVGVVNTSPDARFGHASDGNLDLILARKGGMVDTAGLLMRYIGRFCGCGDERHSVLYDYIKTSAVSIEPHATAGELGCNVDGEAFPGPGPFVVRLLPSLLNAFGEF